ncbi:MAG: DUF1353 domain-containing protein [Hyphomicrobiaceae bacterium]|nr:MAG: DUF1353 domain-containing protein [Hyphomicrobiaceae bacterium]
MLSILLLREGTHWKTVGSHKLELSAPPSYDRGFIPVNIPNGFITDLDTIPRVPIFYGWLKNRTAAAAVWHDFLYTRGYDRKWADDQFLHLMKQEGVHKRYRLPIYWGVRLFGRFKFNKRQRTTPWFEKHFT